MIIIYIIGAYVSSTFTKWMSSYDMQRYALEHPLFVSIVVFIGITNPECMLILSSKIFNLDMMNAPLTREYELNIENSAWIGIFVEVLPQVSIYYISYYIILYYIRLYLRLYYIILYYIILYYISYYIILYYIILLNNSWWFKRRWRLI